MTEDPKTRAQRKRAELVKELGLSRNYQRDHSPTGTRRRRIHQNPDTGEVEILPEPKPVEKPKRKAEDKRLDNLRHHHKDTTGKLDK